MNLIKKDKPQKNLSFFIKAGDGTQTRDLMITNQLLYQLSYTGKCKRFLIRKQKYYKIISFCASD